jgi:hypothetical protein
MAEWEIGEKMLERPGTQDCAGNGHHRNESNFMKRFVIVIIVNI